MMLPLAPPQNHKLLVLYIAFLTDAGIFRGTFFRKTDTVKPPQYISKATAQRIRAVRNDDFDPRESIQQIQIFICIT